MSQCAILIDNTNLFIGGQQLSAERKGVHRRQQHHHHAAAADPSWRLDFEALRRCMAAGQQVHAAVMVGSSAPDEASAWEPAAEAAGFTVVVHDTNAHHEEKAVDTELVARGAEIICTAPAPMILVLASGDRDYVPLVELAHRHGWSVELWAFTSSFSPEGELARSVDQIRPLDDCFDVISRYEFDWPGAG